ncbi:hypothetical protein BAUCODRAFT_126876 [Baudoinia panamericana UAMH 10762]|uniref:Poly A polymerase head domain-containing protein n=1 Tax=Baudoinia panamericana (strain UAMH 10762) TaxID=717646 RepID=M2M5K1_BAUPA|nr:uncharacterized protein BAUCODRAFT_126876 [Baudoinia panamericana UAMH 10762]EMC91906.1 hypothetical protein BAUCODRAFT_126876 [Baudoinia panamericana UAMH 10762]
MAPALIQEVDDSTTWRPTLTLTPVETDLQRLLLDVANYIDNNPEAPDAESHVALPDDLVREPIVLRFTGGWVRDKLLGVDSHDIDVAVNKMTGFQFGLRLKEYLEIPGNPEKYGLEGVATTDKQNQKVTSTDKSKIVGGLHKIEANPEKSKHLETVTTRILGLDIDIVNLRKETYTDDSRNPQMEFGTPEEDALRRDATVNAMFYNLNTEEIEDFTGRGHDDMRDKILRTPLDPHQTFKDDPLRVLRLIRFASRLQYQVDPKALAAMRDADIKDALRRKISRERVGIEIEKSLRKGHPHEALRLVFKLDLYETIFSDPTVETADHYKPDTDGWQTMIDVLQDMTDNDRTLARHLTRDEEENFSAWLLAALVPYRDAPQPEPPAPGRKLPPPVAATVAKEGIKATNKVTDLVIAAVRNQHEISAFVDRLNERNRRPDKALEGDDPAARDILGMAIRRWGSTWRSQMMYSFLVDIVEDQDSVEATQRKYTAFVKHLHDLDILEAYNLKPLLDGKALSKALSTPPGTWMKDALDVVMAWQLRHPGITDPGQAIEEVKQKRGELTSVLVHHFLKLTIRPLFAKNRPITVTESGRKMMKPWKSSVNSSALDLLGWSVSALDDKLVEEVWPLVVPPVLTLLDDWEAKYKRKGAELLHDLLKATPPALLMRTGLAEVFEEALMACLTWLPTITPEDESIALLSVVYPCLLQLSMVRYSKELSSSSKFLDTIIRKGVIQGYSLANQYPRIVAVLFQELVPLLHALGIESVKHLKYILPTLTETLIHPLASAQMPTLTAAVKALQAVILNGWPRMSEYRGEVLKGLTLCWLNTHEMKGEDADGLRREMRETVAMLRVALGGGSGFDEDCQTLLVADGRLTGLLGQA